MREGRLARGHAYHQSGTDFLGDPEIKEPHLASGRYHSRLASTWSAAPAISESSKGPESKGTARRKNSTVKTRFSSPGNASKSSRSRAVSLLIHLGYPLPCLPARCEPGVWRSASHAASTTRRYNDSTAARKLCKKGSHENHARTSPPRQAKTTSPPAASNASKRSSAFSSPASAPPSQK